jgi:hypothetical protein
MAPRAAYGSCGDLAVTLRTDQHWFMNGAGDELITMSGQVEFRLFCGVELRAAGQVLHVGTPRQQAVL